jgi:hypothetical protein
MNRNKLFLNSPLQKAAEFSGVAGEFRCHSLHRSQISEDSDTFGDKRALHLKALRQYRDNDHAGLRRLFASGQSVKDGFAKILLGISSQFFCLFQTVKSKSKKKVQLQPATKNRK